MMGAIKMITNNQTLGSLGMHTRVVQHTGGREMKLLQPYATPYPSHAFTGLSGELLHCFTNGGVPAEIVGAELIAFISLLTQGCADILWPNGMRLSVGANILLICSSADGKSFVYKTLMPPIEDYLAKKQSDSDSVKYLDFLVEDVTREALVKSLVDWPVAGLFTDEVGQLKELLRHVATLVKLLDGSKLKNARVSTGRVTLDGQRLCMLLMGQPDVFEEIKILLGINNGGVGFINRFFVTYFNGSVSDSSYHHAALSDRVEQLYAEKIHELLEMSIQHVETQTKERTALHLSGDATLFLMNHEQFIRRKYGVGSPWAFISEYVLRHTERILRLAGAFHVFEFGIEGEVSLDTIQRAAILGQWHIEAFAQMAYQPPKPTKAEADAIELEHAIREFLYTTGISLIRQSEMRAFAINLGLTPARLTRALAALGGQGKVQVVMRRNTPWIEFKLAYFS
jgi:hypothetical protein